MPTKVKVDFRKTRKQLQDSFKDFQKTEGLKTARIIKSGIVEDTRNGMGYDGKPFPSLGSNTINRRGVLAGVNKTHSAYGKFKSNLTFTGDLIRKIKTFVKGKKIIIKGVGKHKAVKGIRGGTLDGSTDSISSIISELTSRGWNFMGVSKNTKKRIVKQFTQFLRRRKK